MGVLPTSPLLPHSTPQPSPSCPILVCPVSCLFHLNASHAETQDLGPSSLLATFSSSELDLTDRPASVVCVRHTKGRPGHRTAEPDLGPRLRWSPAGDTSPHTPLCSPSLCLST